MKPIFFFPLLIFTTLAFSQQIKDPTTFVNPFIGTGGHGHTYPGAVFPYGMMQLSPDTRLEGWDGCGGYHYSDSIIYGFSHTHLSGTGVPDYCDLLIKPFVDFQADAQSYISEKNFTSYFSHVTEMAKPGYYSVHFPREGIQTELTTTQRCGIHRYTFSEGRHNKILIDLAHRDQVTYSYLKIVSDTEIIGARFSKAWANNQKLYFAIRLSEPVRKVFMYLDDTLSSMPGMCLGTNVKAILLLNPQTTKFLIKVGISATSVENARKNLETEIPGWSFENVYNQAHDAWRSELERISFSSSNNASNINFYTALYHCMIVPNLFMDVDGSYLGRDFEIHKAEDFDYYTVFSLWDTYRGYHPLMTIIDQKRTRDYAKTFLAQYKQGGLLPVWEFASNETWCMIGYHAVPVLADAIMKGILTDDLLLSLEAMQTSATRDHFGLGLYQKYGFIPGDQEPENISKTLEYAYDDWCISQVAQYIGDTIVYEKFIERAQNYKNIFDPNSKFFRPRINGGYLESFDPREVNFHYTEANAWQYSLYVPQDMNNLITLMGGDYEFGCRLDTMFSTVSETTGREQSDITGLIGQYAHGNEPSHHIAYLYAYCGQSWKTQQITDSIMRYFYQPTPDGLIGNEDCGQMSAWYVLSAMGFYPVNPADGIFVFGSPQMDKASISLENGRKFIIECINRSDENRFIQQVSLNGVPYKYSFIRYSDIMAGGKLIFTMGKSPDVNFGNAPADRPYSFISDNQIIPAPFFTSDARTFEKSIKIGMQSPQASTTIHFTTDGSEPTINSRLYKKPILIKKTCLIRMAAFDKYGKRSVIVDKMLSMIPKSRSINILTPYSNMYNGGGDRCLVDFQRGGKAFQTGLWQGYENTNFEAIVDLGKEMQIKHLALGCLQDIKSWIWMPTKVQFFSSEDGVSFNLIGEVNSTIPIDNYNPTISDFELKELNLNTRYIKVVAYTLGAIPAWHLGYGGYSWIFVDEIVID